MDKGAIVEQLRTMGLTLYEAKCYVSLASLGPADPRKVATEARIPYPSAYEALKSLSELGWAELVVRRPATYRARNPDSLREMIRLKIEETFDSLERVYSPQPVEEAELVYTLRGKERVLSKIYEMIKSAKDSIVLAAPSAGLEDSRLLDLLAGAVARGVKVRAVGDEGAQGLLPPNIEIRMGNLVAVDLLVDGRRALISLPDYSACGWIESPAVATHFTQFLELLWHTSSSP